MSKVVKVEWETQAGKSVDIFVSVSQELLDLTKLINGLTTEQVYSGDYDYAVEQQMDLASEAIGDLVPADEHWDFREEHFYSAIADLLEQETA
jgi:hypothetical protein